MNAVIIFDVTNSEKEIKDAMAVVGYSDRWIESDVVYTLPHNMMWKVNTEFEKAKSDLEVIVASMGKRADPPKIAKLIILNSTPWCGVADRKDQPASTFTSMLQDAKKLHDFVKELTKVKEGEKYRDSEYGEVEIEIVSVGKTKIKFNVIKGILQKEYEEYLGVINMHQMPIEELLSSWELILKK